MLGGNKATKNEGALGQAYVYLLNKARTVLENALSFSSSPWNVVKFVNMDKLRTENRTM